MPKFKFKPFQLEDVARAALRDSVIFAAEPGTGKTCQSIAWALLKEAHRVLFVVPGHLHRHFREEAREKFGYHVTTLEHRRQIHSFGLDRPTASTRTRFFITTFHALGYNHTRDGSPTLAACLRALPPDCGFDCVIADESTRLQSGETHLSRGVRTLAPRLRMLLTGTPIKNRLPSIFWLASWIAENEPGLWPYPATEQGRARFARDFLVTSRDAAGGRSETTARITNFHRLWLLLAPFVIRRRKRDCGEAIPKKIVKHLRLQPGTAQAEVYASHLHHPPLFSAGGRPVSGFGQVAMQLGYLRLAALAPHAPSLGKVLSAAHGAKASWTDFNPKQAAVLSLVAQLLRRGRQVAIGSPFRAFSEALHHRLSEAGVSSLLLDGQTAPQVRGDLVEELFKTGRYSTGIFGLASMAEGSSLETCSHLILPARSWAYDENEQFINRVWRINSPRPVTVYYLSINGTIDARLEELFEEKSDSAQLALDGWLAPDAGEEVDLGQLLRSALLQWGRTATARIGHRGQAPKIATPGHQTSNHSTIDEARLFHTWETVLRQRLGRAEVRYQQLHSRTQKLNKKNFV